MVAMVMKMEGIRHRSCRFHRKSDAEPARGAPASNRSAQTPRPIGQMGRGLVSCPRILRPSKPNDTTTKQHQGSSPCKTLVSIRGFWKQRWWQSIDKAQARYPRCSWGESRNIQTKSDTKHRHLECANNQEWLCCKVAGGGTREI